MNTQGTGASLRREAAISPLAQVNLLGFFSLVFTVGYTVAAQLAGERTPSIVYFAALMLVYSFFWGPFYLGALFAIPRLVARGILKLIDLLAMTQRFGTTISDEPPAEAGRSLFTGAVTTRATGSSWPFDQALLVQGFAFAVVAMTAWYTTYTGGPFSSPFGQVLLALPLLSPNVANNWQSILAVYITSVTAAVLAGTAALQVDPPGRGFYWGTTLGVLALSGFVAVTTRWRLEQTEALLRDERREPWRNDPHGGAHFDGAHQPSDESTNPESAATDLDDSGT